MKVVIGRLDAVDGEEVVWTKIGGGGENFNDIFNVGGNGVEEERRVVKKIFEDVTRRCWKFQFRTADGASLVVDDNR